MWNVKGQSIQHCGDPAKRKMTSFFSRAFVVLVMYTTAAPILPTNATQQHSGLGSLQCQVWAEFRKQNEAIAFVGFWWFVGFCFYHSVLHDVLEHFRSLYIKKQKQIELRQNRIT